MRTKSIDKRLARLEATVPGVPGTSLTRVLAEPEGVEWVLGIGRLLERKCFYRGKTVEEVLSVAEQALLGGAGGKGVV